MDPSTGHSSESLFLSEKRAYEARGKVVVSILERPLVAGGLQKPKEFVRDAEISKPASPSQCFPPKTRRGMWQAGSVGGAKDVRELFARRGTSCVRA